MEGILAVSSAMHRNVVAFLDAARAVGVEVSPREFPESTHTAADAAAAVGVEVGRIVKSLVFSVDDEVVVALVSGPNRLDEGKLAAAAGGARAGRVDAETARAATGYPIGGVPPFGHREKLRVFVDEDLLAYDEVWAAAGTPNVNFAIAPVELVRATGGVVCELATG
jgi:Cys-tRNA(Pro) deacylase